MPFSFKWIRLFYLYGSGQSKDAILEQLKTAISRGEKMFNMSPGEQLRDYLPVERVADCIVRIALQEKVQGIVNCCSGKPISIRRLVEDYIRVCGAEIALNLGYYDYPEYEPRAFWGDTRKLSAILEE
jgi:dTDP-6-deoxy-L-talose 4-dehydrogenase (NAD+)